MPLSIFALFLAIFSIHPAHAPVAAAPGGAVIQPMDGGGPLPAQ